MSLTGAITGIWTIDVDVTRKIIDEDMPLLQQFLPPDGVTMRSAEVVVHGRIWTWKSLAIDDGRWQL